MEQNWYNKDYYKISTLVVSPHSRIDCLKSCVPGIRDKVMIYHFDEKGYVCNTIQLMGDAEIKPYFDMLPANAEARM